MHKSYQPTLPAANRLLQKKWDDKYFSEHRILVRDARPSIDTRPPRTYLHLHMKLKKLQVYFVFNIADVLEQTDLDSIVLEIATLAKKYPSLNMDQVIQILLVRGDLTKQEAKDKADAAISYMPRDNQGILFEIMGIIDQMN
ncbi:unnamed protein product [Adineta steineri]|uniref:Uncharacterized protein n=1 Tax=Adineta steineri TaxID=433720 RepID=A0A813S8L8_9BILA|nr:unnamed protein product [Adineta steineri]